MERKRASRSSSGSTTTTKKQKHSTNSNTGGIDMSHIPASLRKEGYTSDFEEEIAPNIQKNSPAIPDYLKCPVCKELFVTPEMFTCGHTVCKMCIEQAQRSSHQVCPVCKHAEIRRSIPNYVVSQLIESQYPELKQQRQQQVEAIMQLKQKAAQYLFSSRYTNIRAKLDEWTSSHRLFSYNEVSSMLKTSTFIMFDSPMQDEEIKILLAACVHERQLSHFGHYFVQASTVESFVDWINSISIAENLKSKSKKKKEVTSEYTKWLPFGILCLTKPHVAEATYKKLASLYKVDIGNPVNIEEWSNQPSFWVKDLDLGDIMPAPSYLCACGQHHGDVSHSDSDDSGESSEEESDFW